MNPGPDETLLGIVNRLENDQKKLNEKISQQEVKMSELIAQFEDMKIENTLLKQRLDKYEGLLRSPAAQQRDDGMRRIQAEGSGQQHAGVARKRIKNKETETKDSEKIGVSKDPGAASLPSPLASESAPASRDIQVDDDQRVQEAICGCPAGLLPCYKHAAAVNIDKSESTTNFNEEWDRPSTSRLRKVTYPEGITTQELLPAESSKGEQGVETCFKTTLVKACECIAEHLLVFQSVKGTHSSKLNVKSKDLTFYNSKVVLTEREIIDLCISTLEQSKCEAWFVARKIRISASTKAHLIRTSRKEASVLADFLLKDNRVVSNRNCNYGLRNEDMAIREYEKTVRVKVVKTGVVVMKDQPWLCASPDGIVVQDGCISRVLEVKCPSSCSDKAVVADGNPNVSYLQKCGHQINVKRSHVYYTQCQMLMYVTGLSECDLYMYSPIESFMVSVLRDEEFIKETILKLEGFYFKSYLKLINEAYQ